MGVRGAGVIEKAHWVGTHYDGTAGALAVDTLVAEVEDQCGSAIKEPKHTDTHKELCRGGEVALKVGLIGWTAVT